MKTLSIDKETLIKNLKSGLTVSLVAIPLSISLSIASGGSPLQGLLAGIWGCIVASIFGSSNFNIYGPAGALSALLLAFVGYTQNPYLLPVLAIGVGVWILIINFFKITKYIVLIPSSALHGFIAGVSLVIASGQINNAFGLVGLKTHEHAIQNFFESISHLGALNPITLSIFAFGMIFLYFWNKKFKSVPGAIVLSVIGIIIGYLISKGILPNSRLLVDQFPNIIFNPIETKWLGELKSKLSDMGFLGFLIKNSFVIAVISILETLISGKIAGKITKTKFDHSKEVNGLGISNIFSGLLGGLPVTAVFIRTALNIKSGATLWISGLIAGFAILIISWLLFPLFKLIPLAIISAILVTIAIGLLDIRHYKHIYDLNKFDLFIVIIVALITFVIDPIYGILVGVLLSLLVYLKNTIDGSITVTTFKNGNFVNKYKFSEYEGNDHDEDFVLIKLGGDINFLSTSEIINKISNIHGIKKIGISFSQVGNIDLDGIEAIEEIVEYFETNNIDYYFTGISKENLRKIKKNEWFEHKNIEKRIFARSNLLLEHIKNL